MTGALRMLAYGAAADQCDEITRMGASTALKCLKKFCRQVEFLYAGWFLRPQNPADLHRLLNRGQRRGFPGMIGSIVCMHWEWKNCPTGWAGAFSGRKGRTAPLVEFEVNNKRYTNGYYLADGIYPRLFKLEDLRAIMISRIILHNMIVEDEFVEEEFAEPKEDDLMNPAMTTVYDRHVHPNTGEAIPFKLVGRDGQNLPSFMDREFQVESAYLHKCLQDDLVMHN
ncbi:uncharacterized protein LOC133744621 [Rosa rugosa]|uniref:uncharacterized protein LOC133744621 n=1 Tax=Rosa rugosa TaxID=74645 RepID=UPI002B4181FE|nr:uncharacterized protein LOC133744621 [Rosa rugosa]